MKWDRADGETVGRERRGKGGGVKWDRADGKTVGRERRGYGGVGNGNAQKQPNNATDLAFGDAHWGLPSRVIHF